MKNFGEIKWDKDIYLLQQERLPLDIVNYVVPIITSETTVYHDTKVDLWTFKTLVIGSVVLRASKVDPWTLLHNLIALLILAYKQDRENTTQAMQKHFSSCKSVQPQWSLQTMLVITWTVYLF